MLGHLPYLCLRLCIHLDGPVRVHTTKIRAQAFSWTAGTAVPPSPLF